MGNFFAGFLIQIIQQICKFIWWIFHQTFKSVRASASSKNLLILGPGETLKPWVRYRELYDYSQTANSKEVINLAHGDGKNGDFWLGKYVTFSHSQARLTTDVWIPSDFLHQHVLIVGPPGAGKTELLLKSAENLMQKGNLVCVDAAGFLGDRLANFASSAGSKLVCWDLSATKNQVVWNFLEELEKFGTEKEIRAIAEALYGNIDDTDPNACFWKRDIMWLTAILGVVVEARRQNLVKLDPSDLPALVMDRDAVEGLLNNLPQANTQWGSDLYSYLSLPDDRFGLDISFLQNKLSPFKDPGVRKICDGASGIFLLQALNGTSRHTLVVGQSLADGKFGSSLAAVMISYVMNVMYRRMKKPQHSWMPTYIICDEAPRLKNIDYEELTAIGRNAKAGVFLMCQSIDQFPEKTLPALNNCRTQIFLQGVSHKTADWLSKPLGEYQRQVMTMIVAQGTFGPSPLNQKNVSYERVPVLGIWEISNRPLPALPSGLSAIVRVNASQTPTTKPFLTDYSA
ncbi:type IV secretory system conjugative DNA transfer family protein [Microcoleus sp. PH2017_30_WIL_O_A]|uniref:type IV secretory system conjugative DNA transfer family protein n=1 Tax=Microcoleus sp. PH2017_30_WIL_O_A TaxID=2798840 RepID=UPI001D46FD3D|nr:type IV secretory system conjugative DNA transfer family protein [Microcoleus sp. PH2017_30_WIL_O_A]MCC3582677.1 type IV secretory system conjugative DNA transfer family protein [Microcoleus sp. PH2017_30_WIL_O_A]